MASPCKAGRSPAASLSGSGADLLKNFMQQTRISANLFSYLASPPPAVNSGLYLHSPALEGMWMGALQEHTGKGVPAPRQTRSFPTTQFSQRWQHTAKEKSNEQSSRASQNQLR